MMREVIAKAIARGGLNPDECAELVMDAISEADFVIVPKEPPADEQFVKNANCSDVHI